jgi:hypothetical protein
MKGFTACFKKCANGSLVKLMHRLSILYKLFVSPYKRPTNKSDSARLHASRPMKLSLQVRVQGRVFDLCTQISIVLNWQFPFTCSIRDKVCWRTLCAGGFVAELCR